MVRYQWRHVFDRVGGAWGNWLVVARYPGAYWDYDAREYTESGSVVDGAAKQFVDVRAGNPWRYWLVVAGYFGLSWHQHDHGGTFRFDASQCVAGELFVSGLTYSMIARFQPIDTIRPHARWGDVTTLLIDFAIVTFAVDPAALQRFLPAGFAPDIVTLDDGSQCALISAVPFRDQDFHFGALPWLHFSFGQTNYRAYITYRGERGVWFFGTSLATAAVAIPRYAWRLPWHHAHMQFTTRWSGERCEQYELVTHASWGEAEVVLTGTDEPAGRLDGFSDAESSTVVLTHPLRGYFYRRDGRVGTYAVWHPRLAPRRGIAHRTRFTVFERLGLITPESIPHSVLLQRATEFIIFLPPQRLMC